MGRLDGKVAVITGGSEGIGLATARLFAAEGASVVVTGRSEATLEAALRLIGGDALAIRGDVSRMEDLDALHRGVAERYGRADIVFANAGTARPKPLRDITPEDFDFEFAVNVRGAFFTVQRLLPLMGQGGSVILNASIQAEKGFANFAMYAATKAAMRSLARTLTTELAPEGIRVNALSPGFIDTEAPRKIGLGEEAIRTLHETVRAQVPMRRLGTADDVARAALFLATDEAGYVTGVELHVDGGSNQV